MFEIGTRVEVPEHAARTAFASGDTTGVIVRLWKGRDIATVQLDRSGRTIHAHFDILTEV